MEGNDPVNTRRTEGRECLHCGEDATGESVIGGKLVPTCDECHRNLDDRETDDHEDDDE